MGFSSSKDKRIQVRGGIHIEINKTYFVSNEIIQGMLHVNLEEPYSGNLLVISLEGIEQTYFKYTTTTNDRKHNHQASGLKRFLNYSFPLYDFQFNQNNNSNNNNNNNQQQFILNPGQWSIPFSLQIGDKLPSSMQYKFDDYNNCSLKYNLCAYIINNNNQYKPIQGHQEIFIGQIKQQQLQLEKQIESNPTYCCCLLQGLMNIECKLNKSNINPNEYLSIKLKCDGRNCKSVITSVSMKVIGRLKVKSDDTYKEYDQIINISSQNQIINNNYFYHNDLTIDLQSNMNLSCNGQLIDLNYFLMITPNFESKCIGDSPSLVLELFVNPINQNNHINSDSQDSQENNNKNNNVIPLLNVPQRPLLWNPVFLEKQSFNEQQQINIEQIHLQFNQKQIEYIYSPLIDEHKINLLNDFF